MYNYNFSEENLGVQSQDLKERTSAQLEGAAVQDDETLLNNTPCESVADDCLADKPMADKPLADESMADESEASTALASGSMAYNSVAEDLEAEDYADEEEDVANDVADDVSAEQSRETLDRVMSCVSEESLRCIDVKSVAEAWKQYAKEPAPVPLLDGLLYEGQIHCLVGAPSTGKSRLALQWGSDWTKEGYKVFYVDLEDGRRGAMSRLSKQTASMLEEMKYATLNMPDLRMMAINAGISFPDYLIGNIAREVEDCGIQRLIIDSLSALGASSNSMEEAQQFMQLLRHVMKAMKLTVVITAHCRKRDTGMPIELQDLLGSTGYAASFDSVSALGRGMQNGEVVTYLKGLKQRLGPIVYDENGVLTMRTRKTAAREDLRFEVIGCYPERQLLKTPVYKQEVIVQQREDLTEAFKESGKSIRKLAKEYGIPTTTVYERIQDGLWEKHSEQICEGFSSGKTAQEIAREIDLPENKARLLKTIYDNHMDQGEEV